MFWFFPDHPNQDGFTFPVQQYLLGSSIHMLCAFEWVASLSHNAAYSFCPWTGSGVQLGRIWSLESERCSFPSRMIIYRATVVQHLNLFELYFHVFKTRKIIQLLKLWVLNEASYTFKSRSAVSNTWSHPCLTGTQCALPLPLSSFRLSSRPNSSNLPDWSAGLWFPPPLNTYSKYAFYQKTDYLMTSCLGS